MSEQQNFAGIHVSQELKKDEVPEFEFLASPYYSPDSEVRERRYKQTKEAMAHFLSKGRRVFSPIVMCHPLACEYDMGLRAIDWEHFNRPFLKQAGNIVVLCLPGWDESRGVNAEIQLARKFKKSIEYIDPLQIPNN